MLKYTGCSLILLRMNNWWFLLNCQYPPIHPSSELVLNKMSPQSFYFAGYPNIPLINLIHKHFRPVSKYIRCHYFLCRNNWCFLMDWELSFTSVWNCIFWNVGLTDRWSKYLLVDRRKPHFTRSINERQSVPMIDLWQKRKLLDVKSGSLSMQDRRRFLLRTLWPFRTLPVVGNYRA